jgi:hypothetical protein
MNGRSRPREGGSEKTIAAVNTILAPTAADIAVPQITDNTPEVDAALALAAAGIYVFPVDHPELSICAGVGKHHDPFDGYSQLTVAPCLVNGFTPRVGRRW